MTDKHPISDYILDHNNQYIIAAKPAGLPIVPDKTGDSNLKNILEAYSKHNLHIITRTDRPVSGLSLFAKSQNAAKDLSAQLKEGTISKSYLAIVEKAPSPDKGELVHYLSKGKNNKSIVVDENHKNGKKAVLTYSTVAHLDNYTILKVELKTGRFHQIRCQLAHIGCPIKGDVKYGARRKNKDRSIYLHAYELSFDHPVTKERKEYSVHPNPNDTLWNITNSHLEEE
ncbi:MAG: RNA pseudouridine synthase [Saprospiraceae bacterium]|nr:RNA pseudouridine synthase [Saprospiraceae bacterium]